MEWMQIDDSLLMLSMPAPPQDSILHHCWFDRDTFHPNVPPAASVLCADSPRPPRWEFWGSGEVEVRTPLPPRGSTRHGTERVPHSITLPARRAPRPASCPAVWCPLLPQSG